jgi:hypothetical protein
MALPDRDDLHKVQVLEAADAVEDGFEVLVALLGDHPVCV